MKLSSAGPADVFLGLRYVQHPDLDRMVKHYGIF
jgi:hypothetical protein